MAKAKRTFAPVRASAAPGPPTRSPAKAARASIDRRERQQAGVRAAVPRAQRLRLQPVKHNAELARD